MSGKGGNFEREIAKKLSKWLTGKEKPYQFWRTPLSGGLATISEENSDLSGDIKGLTPEADEILKIFSIELKTGYPSTSFWQHFKNVKTFNLKDFWNQCIGDALKSGRTGMLIYRKKGKKPIVGIEKKIENRLKENRLYILDQLPSITVKWPNNELPEMVLFPFEDFFNIVSPNDIKGLKDV